MSTIPPPPPPPKKENDSVVSGEGTFLGNPCPTLYVNNINEKIKISELKVLLEFLFNKYGKIIDIQIKSSLKLKGQAFISFQNVEDATKAIRGLQGSMLYYKPLVIRYAKFPSFKYAEYKGILDKVKYEYSESKSFDKKVKIKGQKLSKEYDKPNHILFIQNIRTDPDLDSKKLLEDLFINCVGFIEVRTIPIKKDIAFVEFSDGIWASRAREKYDRFELNGYEIHISFAKG